MKYSFLTALLVLFVSVLVAQTDPEPQPPADPQIISVGSNRVYGKIQDKNSGKGVEAGSVQLFIKDSLGTDSMLHGMLSRPNGDFSFSNLPDLRSYRLVISAMGFEPVDLSFEIDPASVRDGKYNHDLGNIVLEAEVQQLGGVTVSASRPALEMGIDRKIFNASKSLVSTGGTAIDLMKNIPSVSVDIEGNVTLRNSTPQIFVDGRPTILSLDQIPADNIERVELITNPSARFDAASSGGIINIVLKKNKRVGLNGVASIGAGHPSILNSNLSLNMRQGKFNIFLNGGYNHSGGLARSETERINRQAGQATDLFNQYTETDRRRVFRTIRAGVDYFVDNRNTISFTQQVGGGKFHYEETQDQDYRNLDQSPIYFGDRFAYGKTIFRRYASIVNYKHSFPKAGKELTADINYNYGNRREKSAIFNSYSRPDGSVFQPSSTVDNTGANSSDQVTIQVDYVNPISEGRKFEGGLRSYYNTFESLYDVFSLSTGVPQKLPLSNFYKYREQVQAAYATYTDKIGSIGYQIGLRAEYSRFNGELIDSAFKFGYEYPANFKNFWNGLFPSIFLTKEINDKAQVQLNYSRRIRRPNFWQLNPIIDIADPANLRQGNLALQPEFINSFEFNYSQDYKSGNFLAVLYFRGNPNDITEYSDTITAAQYAQLQNAAIDPNAILNTFVNANTTNRYGAEFTVQHKLSPNFSITPTINLQYRTVSARVNDQDLSNEGFNWEAKLITEYKITQERQNVFSDLSFQLLGEYESAEVIPQGRRKPQYSVDLAMRKDFLKDKKGTLTLAINDVFNTNRWGTIYDTENFYQDSYRRWNVRTIRLTFSYKFGDADFSFSNRRGRGDGDND